MERAIQHHLTAAVQASKLMPPWRVHIDRRVQRANPAHTKASLQGMPLGDALSLSEWPTARIVGRIDVYCSVRHVSHDTVLSKERRGCRLQWQGKQYCTVGYKLEALASYRVVHAADFHGHGSVRIKCDYAPAFVVQ